MSKLKTQVEEVVRKEMSNGGFSGQCNVRETNVKPSFSAGIDAVSLSTIEFNYNPEYEQKTGKTEIVAKSIIRHEVNHKGYRGFNGCPKTTENHAELIVEPIADVLGKKGFSMQDFHYCANALEDIIENNDLASGFSMSGQSFFWQDIGNNSEKQKYTEFYNAFVSANLYLFGTKHNRKMLRKHFNDSKKVREVVKNFIEKAGLDIKQEINGKKIKDRDAIRAYLNNTENWHDVAYVFAEEFSKLMKPGYAMPLINHSGKGTKGNKSNQNDNENSNTGNKGNEEGQGKGSEKKDANDKEGFDAEGNPFDKAMYHPDFMKKAIEKKYNEGKEKPSWMNDFQALDYLYQSLAKKLKIKAEIFTKEGAIPIMNYGKRDFNPETDNFRNIKLGFTDSGKLKLQKTKYQEEMPMRYKESPKGFPEIRFCILDTSGSMKGDVHGGSNTGNDKIIKSWGDKSKYHYALLGWYGLLEYLKENHIMNKSTISMANFSNLTYIGTGLDEAKKVALKPQFGDTYLNMSKIKSLFKGTGNLVFTISDGKIANWDEISNEFIKIAKEHNYFHLQIGGKNGTSKELEKAGLKVEYIKSAQDLANRVIDLTDKMYRGSRQ